MSDSINKRGEAIIHCDFPKCTAQVNIELEPSNGWDFISHTLDYENDKDFCPKHAGGS